MSVIPPEYEKYEKTVTIGCCNFKTVWGDKEANLRKIKALTEAASETGVNIIAFPELALSGYECESEKGCSRDGIHKRLAETIPGPATEEMAKVTKERNIYAIFGMPERDITDSERIYISAAVIGPEGIIGAYRKLHLAPSPIWTESFCFSPGKNIMKEIPVFETRYGPIGVAICYDFWIFPEITRIQTLKGARILFNCTASASAPGDQPMPHMVPVTSCRAYENFAFSGSANLVGIDKTKFFYGHSTIAGPNSPMTRKMVKIYAEGSVGEEVVTATLNFELLHKWRTLINMKKDRKALSAQLFLDEFKKLT